MEATRCIEYKVVIQKTKRKAETKTNKQTQRGLTQKNLQDVFFNKNSSCMYVPKEKHKVSCGYLFAHYVLNESCHSPHACESMQLSVDQPVLHYPCQACPLLVLTNESLLHSLIFLWHLSRICWRTCTCLVLYQDLNMGAVFSFGQFHFTGTKVL